LRHIGQFHDVFVVNVDESSQAAIEDITNHAWIGVREWSLSELGPLSVQDFSLENPRENKRAFLLVTASAVLLVADRLHVALCRFELMTVDAVRQLLALQQAIIQLSHVSLVIETNHPRIG